MFTNLKIKYLIRFAIYIFCVSIVGLIISLGISYNDSFYFILALIFVLIIIGTLIKKERLPQIGFPKSKLTSNTPKISNNIRLSGLSFLNKMSLKGLFSHHRNRWLIIEYLLITLFFAILILYKLPTAINKNYLLAYLQSALTYTIKNMVASGIFTLAIIIINVILYTKIYRKRFANSILNSISATVMFLSLSIPTAFIVVFIFTLIFYNSSILISRLSPKTLNLHTDKEDIQQIIDKNDNNFELVGVTQTDAKTFVLNSNLLGKNGDFYVNNFLQNYPNFLLASSSALEHPVYLIKNKIVIKELDKDIFQAFATTLVKKLVKKDLSPRYIKDEPDVQIISRQDYLKYREDEINKAINEIAGYINDSKKLLSSIGYQIQTAKNNISTLQGYIVLNTQYRDNEYNSCINATSTIYGYYSNYTYRLYSDAYCLGQRSNRDQKNTEYQADISTNQKNLAYYQSQYSEIKQYLDQFQDYKVFIESTKSQTPYELGLFEPEKSVKVVLDSVSDKDINNFLVTLTHEYIHYTSYVSEDRSLPQFFEEGLTELLARKVVTDQLHKSTNVGYPVIVKILNGITKKIPINQLEDIYFTKSSDQLESLLDQTYGKDFYKDTQLYFALIPYSPPDEALKFANNIMFKIGEPNLEEKDMYSN